MITGSRPPAAMISADSSSSNSRRRATMPVRTPCMAKAFAVARPMPRLAPVTSAVWLVYPKSMKLP